MVRHHAHVYSLSLPICIELLLISFSPVMHPPNYIVLLQAVELPHPFRTIARFGNTCVTWKFLASNFSRGISMPESSVNFATAHTFIAAYTVASFVNREIFSRNTGELTSARSSPRKFSPKIRDVFAIREKHVRQKFESHARSHIMRCVDLCEKEEEIE